MYLWPVCSAFTKIEIPSISLHRARCHWSGPAFVASFPLISEIGNQSGEFTGGMKIFQCVKTKKLTEAGGPTGSGEDLQCDGGPSGLDRRMCDD